ncbi:MULTISPECIES: MlaC/ttg2D family ABC transporter substrate-binding protein [Paraburkholderia]|uniref:Phospholipid transport system substrate-binding protein n=1 Tax=Paraburkholderia tropica TaxID=92647 RepID=A0ABX5MGM4_9BURK|nr:MULTISPECIES: ABC transporter substrate-binding protein [Paraburkholderia]MBB3003690.1 phospholipid transport system substrate-binding protein [Paraburkholderia tropica]MBB6322978.1 phospholipid transport system substrate-binding protein [Paraburkholderia tropica]MDE1143631.1 ABC transporter substrate-binding protein [Paraburkholderia tropica]PXX10079.1 phospholipid transport system substrate-binding protein [Paraburkholderia tropica]PZW74957.1 phospholipid transport system substrate-bindin
MKKFLLFPIFAMFFAFAGTASAQTVDTSNPDAMVKTITQQVMDQIKGDKSIQSGDISKITQLVNEKILPYTDFRRTTQLAMGRNWRAATPDQQQQVIEQFKTLLIRTYSGALAQVRDQQIDYKPFRANPDDTDVVVRSTVVNNGQPIELDYRLYKTAQGWRVYDINVLGAWLIQAYQQQFQEKIQQGGVQGLISFLTQRNQQLASGKAAS